MLVTVVLAAIVTVTTPVLSSHMRRLEVERTALELAQVLRHGRARAVMHASPVVWRWNAQTRTGRLKETAEGKLQDVPGRFAASGPLPVSYAVRVTSDTPPGDDILFRPNGTSESSMISLESSGHTYTLTVDAGTGHVAIARGTPKS